jgi:hypothetical protein
VIGLAMEIPTTALQKLNPLCDLDFVLAHKVLQDMEYARFYRDRPKGRTLILDNSMHELGEPLPLDSISHAADIVRPDYIIAPDRLGDADWSVTMLHRASEAWGKDRTAATLLGDDDVDRAQMLCAIDDCAELLCLPYRRPRLEWFLGSAAVRRFRRIHLLGMSSVAELRSWAYLAEIMGALYTTRFTCDTSKPVKWGLLGRNINDGRSLRGAEIASFDLLNWRDVSPNQLLLIEQNVRFLRRILSGHDPNIPSQ